MFKKDVYFINKIRCRYICMDISAGDCLSATTSSSFLFLVFLALFLRKIRDLQQRCGADAPHHLSHER